MAKPFFTALVLAEGNDPGPRIIRNPEFLELCGMPVLVHSLLAFERNKFIDSIVLVVPGDRISEAVPISRKYGITKLSCIAEGGSDRVQSMLAGLRSLPGKTEYVLVHDGARPVLSQELIDRSCRYVPLTLGCVAAVPVTETVKVADPTGLILDTPGRLKLWAAQTPQAFEVSLIKKSYEALSRTIAEYETKSPKVTDDAAVVENMSGAKVRIIKGDPRNLRINIPSDLLAAEAYLKSLGEEE